MDLNQAEELDMTKIKFYVSRSRRSAFVIALLVCVAFAIYFGAQANAARFFTKAFASRTHSSTQRQLSFADRVTYQRAIEEVYWRHRIWPAERTEAKTFARRGHAARGDSKES